MEKYLERINFVNNKEPWLNDVNLNRLQDNVENAIMQIETTIIDNLESTSQTDALSAKQGKVLNEKIQRNILTANITSTTIPAGVQTALSAKEQCKVGNKLSIVNGKIKIGTGVSKVLVSGKILLDTTEVTTNFFYILQNSNIINRANGYGIYETLSTAPFLVNVNVNDTFGLSVLTGTNASIYDGSYITVEVVE